MTPAESSALAAARQQGRDDAIAEYKATETAHRWHLEARNYIAGWEARDRGDRERYDRYKAAGVTAL